MGTTPFQLSSKGKAEFPNKFGTSGLGRLSLRNEPYSKQIPLHMKTLGICWIVYGIFRLAMDVAAILLASTATVMFGALLTRVADPFLWMDFFHVFYACCVAITLIAGVLGILGGFALLRHAPSGRGLLLAASFPSLSDLPVGIALSVYTLIVLLRAPVTAEPPERSHPSIRQDIS